MICKSCGRQLSILNGDGQAYCPLCMALKKTNPLDIDSETGDWEGVTR